jgi:hypothetical protein
MSTVAGRRIGCLIMLVSTAVVVALVLLGVKYFVTGVLI